VFTAQYTLSPYIKQICFIFKGLIHVQVDEPVIAQRNMSAWRQNVPTSSNNDAVHMGFMVDTVTLGQVSLWVHWFHPVIIMPPVLYTHISFIYPWHYITLTMNTIFKWDTSVSLSFIHCDQYMRHKTMQSLQGLVVCCWKILKEHHSFIILYLNRDLSVIKYSLWYLCCFHLWD
jgi:hypothetical protein